MPNFSAWIFNSCFVLGGFFYTVGGRGEGIKAQFKAKFSMEHAINTVQKFFHIQSTCLAGCEPSTLCNVKSCQPFSMEAASVLRIVA